MATPPHRFVVLDSLRGICALMVTLYHLNANSTFKQMPLFNNAYLFVDFFFVLSGFVIAINYEARLASGFGIWRFMLLRFGRLYPLYFFVLFCFFIAEAGTGASIAFAAPERSIDTVLANILLLQSFNIFPFETWNWPGWSVATEFWTCLLFALIVTFWPRQILAILMGLSAISLYFIARETTTGMNVTYNFGMLRSIIGFSLGVIVFAAWKKSEIYQVDKWLAFVIEILSILFVLFFVSAVAQSNYSLFAPFVFAIVVFVFARESGPISSFLKHKVFIALGVLSYSIYLVHLLIERKLLGLANYIEAMSGQQLIKKVPFQGQTIDWLGTNVTEGNLWTVFYLVIVVGFSALTYRCIEVPCRLWFRNQALDKWLHSPTDFPLPKAAKLSKKSGQIDAQPDEIV
jgi:peptidoglycan/LPS O-acetylase OafA/YrhL